MTFSFLTANQPAPSHADTAAFCVVRVTLYTSVLTGHLSQFETSASRPFGALTAGREGEQTASKNGNGEHLAKNIGRPPGGANNTFNLVFNRLS